MKPRHFTLVKGKFEAHQAERMLLDLIQSKIQFHQRELLAIAERNHHHPAYSEKRIEQLRSEADKVRATLARAGKRGKRVLVRSVIEITVEE